MITCEICLIKQPDFFNCLTCKQQHCLTCHKKVEKCPFCRSTFRSTNIPLQVSSVEINVDFENDELNILVNTQNQPQRQIDTYMEAAWDGETRTFYNRRNRHINISFERCPGVVVSFSRRRRRYSFEDFTLN